MSNIKSSLKTTKIAKIAKKASYPRHGCIGYVRHSICKRLREKVWMKHNGDRVFGTCYCCDNKISAFDFEAAHVQAVSHGGRSELANLQPVCFTCNRGMSDMNLEDYKKTITSISSCNPSCNPSCNSSCNSFFQTRSKCPSSCSIL